MNVHFIKEKVKEKGALFLREATGGVYILGTNKYGSTVADFLIKSGVPVLGFINDYFSGEHFDGFDVCTSREVPEGQCLINCIVEGRSIQGQDKIISLAPKAVSNYFELQLAFPDLLVEVDFLENTDSIVADISRYQDLYSILGDEESKQTLANLINFRLNRDISFLNSFEFNIKGQYFEPFVELSDNPIFIDGGGFDGFTSVYFAGLYPKYQAIHFFEPNQENFPKAESNLKPLSNVTYYSKGLWSKSTVLRFDATLSSASKVSSSGEVAIPTVSIDELGLTRVDYIKLDIEGAEFEALKGAKDTIMQFKPKLAVCVYHSQQDFLRIPSLIREYRSDYKISLRHYTQGVFETVMYFV